MLGSYTPVSVLHSLFKLTNMTVSKLTNIKHILMLETLLKGAGLAFHISKVLKNSKIHYGCFKAVKLVKKVIIVINGVSTIDKSYGLAVAK